MQNVCAVGTGNGEAVGLFSSTAGISATAVTTNGSVGIVDVRAAWAALPPRFKPNATWVMHETVLNQIRNLDGAASQVDLQHDRQGTTLYGRPVICSDYAPSFSSVTGSEPFLVVADIRAAMTIAFRTPMTVENIPAMRDHNTGRPVFQQGWFAYARVGGNVVNPAAAILLSN
jgi:HK97 family phage major capsid protein